MNTKGYSEEDRELVYEWCNKYLMGKDNAKHREYIIPYLPKYISERLFRKIFNDIGPAQGFYSSSSRGYWVCPPVTNNAEEISAVLDALHERKAKALSTIQGLEPYINEFETRK